jgi:hypothetical protein
MIKKEKAYITSLLREDLDAGQRSIIVSLRVTVPTWPITRG